MALFIGLMSGTSMDAVDAGLVDLEGARAELVKFNQYPIPSDLHAALSQATRCYPVSIPLQEYGRLNIAVGRTFAEAAHQLMGQANVTPAQIIAIGSHGQTVLHQPASDPPFTLQIGDPNTIASLTGITTIADFRGMDIAVGGQGAPLVPAFHAARFRTASTNRVILNIGGMSNITVLPADNSLPVTGFDTGPGNVLLDSWTQHQLGQPFDRDGEWARRGKPDDQLVEKFKSDNYFSLSPPKSTGRDHFNLDWLHRMLAEAGGVYEPIDVQASLARLTAETIADAIHHFAPHTQEIIVCGGGALNQELLRRLEMLSGNVPVLASDRLGLPPQAVEAIAFAWLAKRRLEGLPGNLPSVTGAKKPVVLGGIYHGN